MTKKPVKPGATRVLRTKIKKKSGLKESSRRWLERHMNDPYVQRSKAEGYRSRAAYKLSEIQERARILRRGQRVVDLGCWPGGWLQVAAELVGEEGRVVGVDVAELTEPFDAAQVVFLRADLTDAGVAARVREALGGPADVLLSDAAPKLTGIRSADRAREEALLEAVEALVPQLLRPGGDLLMKLLECPEAQQIARRLGARFGASRILKPEASRRGTSERYLLATTFGGEA